MTDISKYDVVIVKFPFASSLKYKLDFEPSVIDWEASGLLKPSIFKSAVATIEKCHLLTKVGTLSDLDIQNLEIMIQDIC
jgi:mRNA interferase MazF